MATELLRQVTGLFEQRRIEYFLFHGTLLGYVRHGDFLPWDDCLTLAVPQEQAGRVHATFALLEQQHIRHAPYWGGYHLSSYFGHTVEGAAHTWPALDIMWVHRWQKRVLHLLPGESLIVREHDVFPRQGVHLREVPVWIPARPEAVLDQLQYDWRTVARTSRLERRYNRLNPLQQQLPLAALPAHYPLRPEFRLDAPPPPA